MVSDGEGRELTDIFGKIWKLWKVEDGCRYLGWGKEWGNEDTGWVRKRRSVGYAG